MTYYLHPMNKQNIFHELISGYPEERQVVNIL